MCVCVYLGFFKICFVLAGWSTVQFSEQFGVPGFHFAMGSVNDIVSPAYNSCSLYNRAQVSGSPSQDSQIEDKC